MNISTYNDQMIDDLRISIPSEGCFYTLERGVALVQSYRDDESQWVEETTVNEFLDVMNMSYSACSDETLMLLDRMKQNGFTSGDIVFKYSNKPTDNWGGIEGWGINAERTLGLELQRDLLERLMSNRVPLVQPLVQPLLTASLVHSCDKELLERAERNTGKGYKLKELFSVSDLYNDKWHVEFKDGTESVFKHVYGGFYELCNMLDIAEVKNIYSI